MNYLFAPAITYIQPEELITYGMKIPLDKYFELALPGFILFVFGMYIIPTKIFRINTKEIDNLIKELNTSDLAKSQKFSANVQEIKVGK